MQGKISVSKKTMRCPTLSLIWNAHEQAQSKRCTFKRSLQPLTPKQIANKLAQLDGKSIRFKDVIFTFDGGLGCMCNGNHMQIGATISDFENTVNEKYGIKIFS